MYAIFIIVEVLISIVLMAVVLMQASKGGGLAGSFGGANLGAVFGVRRTSDFLSKTTTVLATAFLALALLINMVLLPRTEQAQQSVIQSVPPATSLPPAAQPQQQGSPGGQLPPYPQQ